MTFAIKRGTKALGATALALSLTVGLSGCATGTMDPTHNSSLNSVNQPVVQSSNFTLDLAANSTGLSVPEQARLADWFTTLDLGYGDRISIDDASANPAVREDVAAVASRFSARVMVGDASIHAWYSRYFASSASKCASSVLARQ